MVQKQSIADFIKDYMESHRISLREVAENMGVSYQNVWLLLNERKEVPGKGKVGRRDPNYLSVKRLLDAIGLEVVIEQTEPTDPKEVLEMAEHENIGFGTLQKVLTAGGFKMVVQEMK